MEFIDVVEKSTGGTFSFTADDKEFLRTHMEQVELKKGDFIIQQGESATHLYMLNSGIIRYWTYNTKDEESTFWFTFPHEVCFSAVSLHLRTPSTFYGQAIKDCTLSRISYEDLYKLCFKNAQILLPAMIMTLTVFNQVLERDINQLKMRPYELYEKMLHEKKEYIQQIPLKYLASYLGITPQALSRIRRKIN